MRARVVVNAAGVWSDDVRALDEGDAPGIDPAGQGDPHRAALGRRCATTSPPSSRCPATNGWCSWCPGATPPTSARPTPTTTGPLDDPPCTPDDVDYLLAALNGISEEQLTAADVVGTWAGLRPLLRTGRSTRTSDLSRRHTVRVAPSGVVTVTGGKLTTYRRMAADAVDAVRSDGGLGERGRQAVTHEAPAPLRRRGHRTRPWPRWNRAPTSTSSAATAPKPTSCARSRVDDPDLAAPLVPGLPYLRAEARVRGAARDGPHARRRAVTSHPRAAARARRVGRCRGVGGGAARARPRVVRHRARRRGRRVPGVDRAPNAPAIDVSPSPMSPLPRHGSPRSRRTPRPPGRSVSGRPARPTPSPPPAATGGRWR